MTPKQSRKQAEQFVHRSVTAESEPPVRLQRVVRRCARCGARYSGRNTPDACIRYILQAGQFCGGKVK